MCMYDLASNSKLTSPLRAGELFIESKRLGLSFFFCSFRIVVDRMGIGELSRQFFMHLPGFIGEAGACRMLPGFPIEQPSPSELHL